MKSLFLALILAATTFTSVLAIDNSRNERRNDNSVSGLVKVCSVSDLVFVCVLTTTYLTTIGIPILTKQKICTYNFFSDCDKNYLYT